MNRGRYVSILMVSTPLALCVFVQRFYCTYTFRPQTVCLNKFQSIVHTLQILHCVFCWLESGWTSPTQTQLLIWATHQHESSFQSKMNGPPTKVITVPSLMWTIQPLTRFLLPVLLEQSSTLLLLPTLYFSCTQTNYAP